MSKTTSDRQFAVSAGPAANAGGDLWHRSPCTRVSTHRQFQRGNGATVSMTSWSARPVRLVTTADAAWQERESPLSRLVKSTSAGRRRVAGTPVPVHGAHQLHLVNHEGRLALLGVVIHAPRQQHLLPDLPGVNGVLRVPPEANITHDTRAFSSLRSKYQCVQLAELADLADDFQARRHVVAQSARIIVASCVTLSRGGLGARGVARLPGAPSALRIPDTPPPACARRTIPRDGRRAGLAGHLARHRRAGGAPCDFAG